MSQDVLITTMRCKNLSLSCLKDFIADNFQLSSKLDKFFEQFNLDILQAEQDNAALTLLPIRSKLNLPIVLDLHGIWP